MSERERERWTESEQRRREMDREKESKSEREREREIESEKFFCESVSRLVIIEYINYRLQFNNTVHLVLWKSLSMLHSNLS